jgi:hypothetical protein
MMLTRLAVLELLADDATPAEMKEWLRAASPGLTDLDAEKQILLHARTGVFPRGADGLAFWSTMPDLNSLTDVQQRKLEPFGVPERELHFIDLEYFWPADQEQRKQYADDLSGKPPIENIPRDMKDERWKRSGMLPWRVEQCIHELVRAFRSGRLIDKPGQFPRDEHATKWAGFLAHYAEDNTQPQHATIDYKSATYFSKNTRKAPNVHKDVEYRLIDDDEADYLSLREEFWPLLMQALKDVQDPSKSQDPWMSTLEISLYSYDALPLIGRAAQVAYPVDRTADQNFDANAFFHFKGKVRDKEMTVLQMKAHQMALGVKRVEKLWRKAWDEAHDTERAPAQDK